MRRAAQNAPIHEFNRARGDIVRTVVARVTDSTTDSLLALNDAAYHETKRLEKDKSPEAKRELGEWQKLARALGRMPEVLRRERLREMVEKYAWDTAGNFNPRVFSLSTRLLPPLITGLLAPRTYAKFWKDPTELTRFEALSDKVRVEGPLEKLRSLAALGTNIYVPTHVSNMDSIVFGYALERAGLPPATYGAGKNLFTNPILSFFMHNLGAYRVDRRIGHNLYKNVLKTYSCVLLERGYHSLFFPGGTRARSGGIERKLKLGLLGTAVEAYARTILSGKERRVFFVPATINYLITLEAETLIADFLSEEGKGRFIIDDDESTHLAKVAGFSRKLLNMDSAVVIRFSEPLDPFGNLVDETGRSLGPHGRVVDPSSYLKNRLGKVELDGVRDAQYTRELGEAICQSYARDVVVMSTHVTAAAVFEALRKLGGSADLFSVLRQRGVVLARDALVEDIGKRIEVLRALEAKGQIRLGQIVKTAGGDAVLDRALHAFAGYHSVPALKVVGGGIEVADPELVFYYQNRLAAHGLAWDAIAPKGVPAKTQRSAR